MIRQINKILIKDSFKFLLICGLSTFSGIVFADSSPSKGFYVGVDPTKMNHKIGNINNSISEETKVAEDRYYGYKFSEAGFFIAPEVAMRSKNSQISFDSSKLDNNYNSNNTTTNSAAANVSYNIRANIGYEFDKSFSGFLTYDVGSFSYVPAAQRPVAIGIGNAANSVVGIGSQINLSNSFGVKISYSQQQFENNSNGGGRIRSEVVKVGTVYSF